jgi:hypothetical protein
MIPSPCELIGDDGHERRAADEDHGVELVGRDFGLLDNQFHGVGGPLDQIGGELLELLAADGHGN